MRMFVACLFYVCGAYKRDQARRTHACRNTHTHTLSSCKHMHDASIPPPAPPKTLNTLKPPTPKPPKPLNPLTP